MLSKQAEKLLKWIAKHPETTKVSEIAEKNKAFDRADIKMLYQEKLICYQFDEVFDNWDNCRITGAGKAYLREIKQQARKRCLELLTIGISIAALFGVDAIAEGACKLWEIIRTLLS